MEPSSTTVSHGTSPPLQLLMMRAPNSSGTRAPGPVACAPALKLLRHGRRRRPAPHCVCLLRGRVHRCGQGDFCYIMWVSVAICGERRCYLRQMRLLSAAKVSGGIGFDGSFFFLFANRVCYFSRYFLLPYFFGFDTKAYSFLYRVFGSPVKVFGDVFDKVGFWLELLIFLLHLCYNILKFLLQVLRRGLLGESLRQVLASKSGINIAKVG